MTTFTITRTFAAPRERVFACFTDPARMERWFSGGGATIEFVHADLRPGGYTHIRFTQPDGVTYHGRYEYLEVEPVSRIVYLNAFADADANLVHHPMAPDWPLQLLTTITLEERDDATELTLTWVPYEASDAEERVFADNLESCRQGWTGTFDGLDAYLAAA